VRPFDLAEGCDLRDEGAVRDAVRGCDAVVHAGAIAHDTAGTPAGIVATNVLGTWHVLLAAETHGVARVVYFSSAQVFGFAGGEGSPAYLPVDDEHPLRAARPYGMSKRLAEEMCQAWTARTKIPTVVLRPVMILNDESLTLITENESELGAFVHVADVAEATALALQAEVTGHVRMTLCGPGSFDTAAASKILGWRPRHTWPAEFPAGIRGNRSGPGGL
jgi:nucleoside-diphosphate-sugar epimerase